MTALLDVQRAMYRSLVGRDDGTAAAFIAADERTAASRLNIYRNTLLGSLTTALRLSYPTVHHLVGAAFFEGAAASFIERHIPRSACLDSYGDEFAEFLAHFPSTAGLPYLAGVARLEWAVNVALHADDADALDLRRLATVDPVDRERIALVPHPSVGLVHDDHPADAIWRAVLAQDDAAMAAINLDAGPVWLLVDRRETGVDVTRISEGAWRFMSALCACRSLQVAFDVTPDIDATAVLAEHLATGRFIDFKLIDQTDPTTGDTA